MLTRFLSTLLLAAAASFAADLNGKWTGKVQGPNGEMDVAYNFKVEDGKISGTVSSHMGEMKIVEGTLSGDEVSFVLSVTRNGEERKVPHKGKVKGDELDLTLEFGEQSIEIHAKRAAS